MGTLYHQGVILMLATPLILSCLTLGVTAWLVSFGWGAR